MTERERAYSLSCAKGVIVCLSKRERVSVCSVTRFGNFLDFGQLFKAFGNN